MAFLVCHVFYNCQGGNSFWLVKIGENVSPLWTSKGSQGNVSCCGFETVNVVSVLLLYSQLHVNLVACWFDCLFQRRVLAPMNIGNIKAPFLNCDPHTVAVQGDLDVLWKHEFLDFSELPVLETGRGSHHSPGDSLPNWPRECVAYIRLELNDRLFSL